MHANAMLETRMPAGLALIAELKQKGYPLAYVGDVVGTDIPQPWGMAAGSNRDGAVKNKQ
jgi:aconitase B